MRRIGIGIAILTIGLGTACTGRATVAGGATPEPQGQVASEGPAATAPAPTPVSAPGAAAVVTEPAAEGLAWKNDFGRVKGDPACPEGRVVEEPGADDLLRPVWEAYDAARRAVVDGDEEAQSARFVKQFAARHKESWIREQYWPRIKQHVSKYTRSSADASFVVCRTAVSGEETKVYVRSFGLEKSDPPITVAPDGGRSRIVFFSY